MPHSRHRSILYLCLACVLGLGLPVLTPVLSYAQQTAARTPTAATGVLSREEAAKLMPATVFFAGKTAPVEARNTGGLRLRGGPVVLAGLVDTSGYSSGVQSRYQAYFLTEAPLRIEGKTLPVGAYGCGFVQGQFLVLNVAGKLLFSVPATHDTAMRRPDPLQFLPAADGSYRLYSGRDYVTLKAGSQ